MLEEILALNAKRWEQELLVAQFLEQLEEYEKEQQ